MKHRETIALKDWAESDKPREKMQAQGRQSVTDAELIAVLLGSGTSGKTALDLAREMLSEVKQDLHALARWDLPYFNRFHGMGPAKAMKIMAALELGLRRQHQPSQFPEQVVSSKQAAELLQGRLGDLPHEEFWIALLSQSNRLIKICLIGRGGLAGTLADFRIIYKHALESMAPAIIVYHNHPSGNLKPSSADQALTKKAIEAGRVLDIRVLDHIIIAGPSFFSFADEGLMEA